MVLSLSHHPLSPPFSPLPSALVLCLQPLRGAQQPVPARAALPFASQGRWPVSPSLPAPGSGAFSACSSHPHSCWQRRKGGRAPRMDPGVDLVLARNCGTTQPAGLLPPLSNCSSAPQSPVPSPAFGPFLSCALAVAISLSYVCPASGVALPLPSTPFPFGCPSLPPVPLLRSPLCRGGRDR